MQESIQEVPKLFLLKKKKKKKKKKMVENLPSVSSLIRYQNINPCHAE